MILGMKNVFPAEFIVHFLNFFDSMFDKTVVTSKSVWEILKNNPEYEWTFKYKEEG